MATLSDLAADLAPATKDFEILKGKTIKIRGLSSGEISDISKKYPNFGEFINSSRDAAIIGDIENMDEDQIRRVANAVDVSKFFTLSGDAFPAIISAGCNQHENDEYYKLARGMAPSVQRILTMEILGLTFPRESVPLENEGQKLET